MQEKIFTLRELGWDNYYRDIPGLLKLNSEELARITSENKSVYTLQSQVGKLEGFLRGKKLYQNQLSGDLPKVGDWVEIEKLKDEKKAIIKNILPRKSKLSRKEKMDSTNEQVLVANIEVVFIVQGLDEDFNLRRLERYIAIIQEGGSDFVIILNKADLVDDVEKYIEKVTTISPEAKVLAISAKDATGITELATLILPTQTVVFVGSSGTGKSTIINRLFKNEIQTTQTVREDDSKGRHTTTRRELFILPNGGIVIDTPGIREIGISSSDSIDASFSDIKLLMSSCKFTKCDHDKSEGCAIKKAIEKGELDERRYRNFLKLEAESERNLHKKSISYSQERKYKKRAISKRIRKLEKHTPDYFDF